MPNPYNNSNTNIQFELKDFFPALAIIQFVFPSWILHQFDRKIVEIFLKLFIFVYIFLPLFNNFLGTTLVDFLSLNSNFYITNYFFNLINKEKYQLLTTLYLLAPLIALYFKEHGSIIDDFVSKFEQTDSNETRANKVSLLDLSKDTYDKETLSCRMSKLFINERSLQKYKLLIMYFNWVKIAGEKRRISDIRVKILFIVLLIIIGMPFSLSESATIYYKFSLSVLVFILFIIVTQSIFSLRNILKMNLLNKATHGAYYYYEKEQSTASLV